MTTFRVLDIHPAWGYETEDRWRVAVQQRIDLEKQKKQSAAKISESIAKSIEPNGTDNNTLFKREFNHFNSTLRKLTNNVAKGASCIPGMNVFMGIGRIAYVLQDRTENKDKKAIIQRHIQRGIADICAGPLLWIVDIWQTLEDEKVVRAYLADAAKKDKKVIAYPLF